VRRGAERSVPGGSCPVESDFAVVAREKQIAIVYQQWRILEGDLPEVIRLEAKSQVQAFRRLYAERFAGKVEHGERQLHLLDPLTGRRGQRKPFLGHAAARRVAVAPSNSRFEELRVHARGELQVDVDAVSARTALAREDEAGLPNRIAVQQHGTARDTPTARRLLIQGAVGQHVAEAPIRLELERGCHFRLAAVIGTGQNCRVRLARDGGKHEQRQERSHPVCLLRTHWAGT